VENNKGFTLIELIISIAILGLVAVTFLSIFNMGLTNIKKAGDRTSAVEMTEKNLYDNVLEEFNVTVTLPNPNNEPKIEVTVKGKIYKSKEYIGYSNDYVDIIRYVPIK
jgi:prepilin-type N-terminal cleavage/methylation domain-containing protein